MKRGSLIVVGTGIMLAGQCSIEARSAIASADVVFSMMGDAMQEHWLRGLNPRLRALEPLYAESKSRPAAYQAMAGVIMTAVREGADVCAVFYGHPGVFVTPSHEAIRAARAEGFDAVMLPAISAEDCLFADLGLDPGRYGCQSYEARDFFLNARVHDPHAALVLWQIAVLGDSSYSDFKANPRALEALSSVLAETYPDGHGVVVYEAAASPAAAPFVQRLRLADLATATVSQGSTLYVPAMCLARPSPERRRLLERFLSGEPAPQ